MRYLIYLILCGMSSIVLAHEYREVRDLVIAADSSINQLAIVAGAGSLQIEGRNQTEVNVRAEIVLDAHKKISEEDARNYLKKNMQLF